MWQTWSHQGELPPRSCERCRGYTPKNNTNKVNNIELNEHDAKDDDVNMTDVVQHITHNDQDDDLVDFDSDSD